MGFNTYPSNPWPMPSDNAGSGGSTYILPTASADTLGGVKVGDNLNIDDGVLSAPDPYELQAASDETLGGIKVGSNLSIDENGVLSAAGGSGVVSYSLTEREIGTWIDGKKLYERTFNIFSNGASQYPVSNSEYDIGLSGVDTAFVYGVVGERLVSGTPQYVDWGNTPTELIVVLNKTAGKLYINPKTHTYDNFYVTIRYTKAQV